MKRLIFFLLIPLIGINAKGSTKIGELYYNLDSSNKTAIVTFKSNYSADANRSYVSGDVIIEENIVSGSTSYRVVGISNDAFSGCANLTSIILPNSIISIGNSAFSLCSGLTSIEIPNSVTSIGLSAFISCNSLTSITIPTLVTSIESSTFSGCSALTNVTIPPSVISIGEKAFYGCSALTNVIIPPSLTFIEKSTFEGCSALTNLTIPPSVITIGKQAFKGCSSLTCITIPSSVTSIEQAAFNSCNSLKELTIEDGDTDLMLSYCCLNAGGLFHNCPLASVYLGRNLVYISNKSTGYSPFYHLTSLKEVLISHSVTSIGSYAFSGCTGISKLDIPTSVTSIESSAFSDCAGLSSLELPGSVATVKDNAFANCINLNELTICSSIPEFSTNAFSGCTNLSKITLKEEVGTLGSVIIPSSVRFVTSLNSTPPTITNTTFNSETTQNGFLFVTNKDITTYQYSPYWCDFLRIESVPRTGNGDSNDQNSENIFNTKIDKYIYMGLDEEFSFTDLLPSGSSASSWESSDDDVVEVTKRGKAEAYEYGNVIVRALDSDGETLITLGVLVCPTVSIQYGEGKSYQHHAIYNSTPNLYIAAPDGYEIDSVSHDGVDVTEVVKANEGYYTPASPITDNTVISVELNSTKDPADLNGDGVVNVVDMNILIERMNNY